MFLCAGMVLDPASMLDHPYNTNKALLSRQTILACEVNHFLITLLSRVLWISIAEMLMFCRPYKNRYRDRNDGICDRLGVAPIKEKLAQRRLR